jgi:hypothetical protein
MRLLELTASHSELSPSTLSFQRLSHVTYHTKFHTHFRTHLQAIYQQSIFSTIPLKMLKKHQNSTIQSFFPPVPSKKRRVNELPTPPTTPWTPKDGITYQQVKIGEIKPGPGRITFSGRVANYREVEKNNKLATAAKVLLRMTLADETGAIDVEISLQHLFPA